MKIGKINFKNHSILGTIELDFTNKEGKIADTIIPAGENGVVGQIFHFKFYL